MSFPPLFHLKFFCVQLDSFGIETALATMKIYGCQIKNKCAIMLIFSWHSWLLSIVLCYPKYLCYIFLGASLAQGWHINALNKSSWASCLKQASCFSSSPLYGWPLPEGDAEIDCCFTPCGVPGFRALAEISRNCCFSGSAGRKTVGNQHWSTVFVYEVPSKPTHPSLSISSGCQASMLAWHETVYVCFVSNGETYPSLWNTVPPPCSPPSLLMFWFGEIVATVSFEQGRK